MTMGVGRVAVALVEELTVAERWVAEEAMAAWVASRAEAGSTPPEVPEAAVAAGRAVCWVSVHMAAGLMAGAMAAASSVGMVVWTADLAAVA